MAKTIKTRLQHKRGTASDWSNAATFVPLEGELILYTEEGAAPKMKFGDGVTTVGNLPFCTGVIIEEEGTDSIPFVDMAHIANGQEVKY
jgi:hypothetical protein